MMENCKQLTVTSKAGQPLLLRYNNKVVNIPTTKNSCLQI